MTEPQPPAPGRVLAVGAHPDDVEFLCAGTLALLQQAGWSVAIATLTPGDKGSGDRSGGEMAVIRREEARHSAALLGAEYRCLDVPDLEIFFGDELCRRVTDVLREVRPDVVFTLALRDYLADHEETARIVRQACFAAPVPGYHAGRAEPLPAIPWLYYCDPVEGVDELGRPVPAGIVVDIGEVMKLKTEMLACHASQREWLRQHHGADDYIEWMRTWSAQRGGEVGVEHGEGFWQHRGHAFPRNDRLRAALGHLVHEPRSDGESGP